MIDGKMDTEDFISRICFEPLPETCSKQRNISCAVVFGGYEASEEDWVGLFSDDCVDVNDCLARITTKEVMDVAIDDSEKQKIGFDFTELCQDKKSKGKHHFKYVNTDLKVLAVSDAFEIPDEKLSSESLFTVQTVDSFDDTILLVKKLSKCKSENIEEDLKRIESQLVDARRKLEQQEECTKYLENQLKKKERECDEEQNQRERTEKAVEELGRTIAEQIHLIEEQGQKVETLERNLMRETKLNGALKEDLEGQKVVFEERLIDYEQQRMKIINYRTELKRLKKLVQEDREIFAERSSKYDEEILLLKQKNQQKITESNLKLQEKEFAVKELEASLEFEEHKCLSLERKMKALSKEYEGYIEEKDHDINSLKDQMKELKRVLEDEMNSKSKLVKDHESTIAELEKTIKTEKAKESSLLIKCDEMKRRAISAEENSLTLKLKLEETDKKMLEMEDLIKASKSELELLRNAVSKGDSSVHKETRSDSQISNRNAKYDTAEKKYAKDEQYSPGTANKKNSAPSLSTKSNSKIIETTETQRKKSWHGSEDLTKTNVWYANNGRASQISVVGRETGKFVHRYSGRRYGQQEESFSNFNANLKANCKDFNASSRQDQPGQVRQHRNSLLRENSRLRYSVSLLNHNCAILNYTIQQVVNEAEQKLESIYAMYLEKESECAAYMSQLQGGALMFDGCYAYDYTTGNVNYYDQCDVQSNEYVASYPMSANCFQNGAIITAPYGYYEVYCQEEPLQQGMMGQAQYVQPVYLSPAISADIQQS